MSTIFPIVYVVGSERKTRSIEERQRERKRVGERKTARDGKKERERMRENERE
jgi:hypothetical protein